MANQRHVDILLRDGVAMWNLWRKEEPATRPDLSEANLREAYLPGADLSDADLPGADLSGTRLDEADLSRADLTRANLPGASLSEAHLHMAALHEADISTARLDGARLTWARLRGANLRETDLYKANLTRADLREADLRGANLREAHLIGADLSNANLTGANLSNANLTETDLYKANLTRVNLREASCIRTRLRRATLTGCLVYGISAWDVDLENAVQADLDIAPLREKSAITVDNLEVAQFLYLLLHNKKVRKVLDTITSKVVLILGPFSEERKPVLDALREALRRHPNSYIPVMFDFDPQRDKPVLETVKTLANLARFVIADLTDPRMVRSELTYITANVPTVPVQPIMQRDADLPPEHGTWALYKSFLPVYRYADLAHLLASLTDSVIAPIEGHVVARRLADADSL